MIGCTQPRRIAARAVAKRVADELEDRVGGAVGYQVNNFMHGIQSLPVTWSASERPSTA